MFFIVLFLFFLFTELSQVHNKHICRRLLSLDSVAALSFVACQSKKAANIHNRWLSYRRRLSLGSKNDGMIVLEKGEHRNLLYSMLVFAIFLLWQATKSSARTFYYLAVKPQVTFASLSSPAVMDIRRLLALASDKVERGDACLR